MGFINDHSKTILAVDDDPGWLEIYREDAERYGIYIITAENVPSAQEKIANYSFDAAVLDKGGRGDVGRTGLPGYLDRRGGLYIARQIKDAQPGCQVIINTGEGHFGKEVVDSGADGFLNKLYYADVYRWIFHSLTENALIMRKGHPRELQEVFSYGGPEKR